VSVLAANSAFWPRGCLEWHGQCSAASLGAWLAAKCRQQHCIWSHYNSTCMLLSLQSMRVVLCGKCICPIVFKPNFRGLVPIHAVPARTCSYPFEIHDDALVLRKMLEHDNMQKLGAGQYRRSAAAQPP